jgi:hypothetical protein
MSARVYLHVGLPKSGTSFVQKVLAANKALLRDRDGLLFPGEGWKDQVAAVRDVRRMGRRPKQTRGAWRRLLDEITAWPGDSIVSMEWLCAATPDEVQRILEDLAPAEVHAVFTVRDIGRTLPSSWQEMMQNRKPWTWDEFLDSVTSSDKAGSRAGRRFWSQRDLAALLPRWTAALPADQVHVVTVPPASAAADELWRRMCSVLQVDPTGHRTSDLGDNASLGLESAELMRRVNVAAGAAGFGLTDYHTVYKRVVAKRVLAARRAKESRLAVPESLRDWLEEAAGQQLEVIRSCGAEVVGDLDDLRPAPPGSGIQPQEVQLEELLSAAVDALVGLGREHLETVKALDKARKDRAVLRRRLTKATRQAAAATEQLDRPQQHPARRIVSATRRRLRGPGGPS